MTSIPEDNNTTVSIGEEKLVIFLIPGDLIYLRERRLAKLHT